MAQGAVTQFTVRLLELLRRKLGVSAGPRHLETGRAGEEAAYFHLRRQGYTIIARNWRTPRRRGELDMVGWDGETLCFIEVKTRRSGQAVAAELAVDAAKQDELRAMARVYLKRHSADTPYRFDVVSVYEHEGAGLDVGLIKDAFAIHGRRAGGRERFGRR